MLRATFLDKENLSDFIHKCRSSPQLTLWRGTEGLNARPPWNVVDASIKHAGPSGPVSMIQGTETVIKPVGRFNRDDRLATVI